MHIHLASIRMSPVRLRSAIVVALLCASACHPGLSRSEWRTYLNNKKIIASAKHSVVVSCDKTFTWRTGLLAGTTAFVFVEITPDGKTIAYNAHWGSSQLNHPERQTGIVAGVTKWLAVSGQATWFADHPSPLTDGKNGITITIEAFPRHNPIGQGVRISALTPSGHAIDAPSFAAQSDQFRTSARSVSFDSLTLPWKTIYDYGLDRTGVAFDIDIDGEQERRHYVVPAEVLSQTLTVFNDLLAEVQADSHAYLSKCTATEQIPIS